MSDDLRIQVPATAEGVGWIVYQHLSSSHVRDSRVVIQMNSAQLDVLAFQTLRTEVNADGFSSYLQNWADTAAIVPDAALKLGGPVWRDLIVEAFRLLGETFPEEQTRREEIIFALIEANDDEDPWHPLDLRLYDLEVSAPVDTAVDQFVWSHKAEFFHG